MTGTRYVPDEGPLDADICFVGEAPGETEEREQRPFVGESGNLLTSCLGRNGISRDNIRLSNLVHYRPAGNNFKLLLDSTELYKGLAELQKYLQEHRPKVICALGAYPLKFLTGKDGIFAWRGSILECTLVPGLKVVPTFHPAYVLRDRAVYPIFDFDIKRVSQEASTHALNLPEREFVIDPKGLELEEIVTELENEEILAVDIESRRKSNHILCIGFAPRPGLGVCIVNHQTPETDNAIARILSSPAKKVFHFGTFDTEVLYLNGFTTNNYWWDTLVAAHILNPELPLGLDFLSSVYTREPYYKSSGRAEIPSDQKSWSDRTDKDKLYIYNCRDICVTREIQIEQEQELRDRDKEMFDYEMSLIPLAQHIGRTGLPIDIERRAIFDKAVLHRWYKLQAMMEVICETEVNVRSPKLKDVLYDRLKLPVRKNRGGGITTDEDAIVSLITYCTDYTSRLKTESSKREWQVKLLVLKSILEIRGLRQSRSNYFQAGISDDSRYRSIYKYSNTKTGRGACEKYLDGTGINAQTVPRGYVEVPDNLRELDEVQNPVDDSSTEGEATDTDGLESS